MASALFLCGMPGSGKSKLGKKLASRLKIKFLDLDWWIEQAHGMSPASWISAKGEESFRLAEAEALRRIPLNDSILISCGGGTPCFLDNLEYMLSNGVVVYIDVPLQTLVQRLSNNSTERPLLAGGDLTERLTALWQERKTVYQSIDRVISPLKQSEQQMVGKIQEWLNQHK